MRRSGLAFGVALLTCATLSAERLPIQVVTVGQGLAGNSIHKIVRDSHGFLWFCTGEGLSRFDGYRFVNFGPSEGLPGQAVWDLLESRSGDYWVATNGGLIRLPGAAGGHREVYYPGDAKSRAVLAVHESADSTLWAGTEAGLYRMPPGSRKLSRVDTGPLPESWSQPPVAVITEDAEGNLWFGGFAGIGRLGKGGRIDRWTPRHGFASYVVAALLRDFDGTIWAGTEEGLCHLLREPRPGESPAQHCYGLKEGLPSPYTQSVLRDSSGRLWVATLEGTAYETASPDGRLRFSRLTRSQGLTDDNIESLAEDIDGNLWFGSGDEGAMKMSREDVVQFGEQDGLTAPVAGFFEDLHGTLYAITRSESAILLNRFDGRRFVPIRPALPPGVRTFGRGMEQVAIQDQSGDWWMGTGDGLLHYRASRREPLSRLPDLYVHPGGHDGHNVFRLYEDSRGDVWWSTSSRITNTLGRWRRAEAKMEYFDDNNGLPPLRSNLPSAFVEDRTGTLWLGFESQGIARQQSAGGFMYFDPAAGWPGGRIRTAHRDVKGRLWFGSSIGLWRLDDPAAARPVFVRYTPAEGLASLTIHSLTSDRQGRIYVGTGFGVDRIDPDRRHIEHLSTSDGFPSSVVQTAYCDREGRIWFGVRHGAIRFIPTVPLQKVPPATARITSLRVRGIDRSVGAAGATTMDGLVLKPGEDQIEFAFAAPRFRGSAERRYQYRLEGAGSSEWSAWSTARSVNFASLAPGSYRFLARAEDSGGLASVTFRILPPFWLSWWFRVLLVSLLAASIYLLFRYRMRAALERERLRTRIATDLHDDIGSSLSRIAIWSDVAARELERGAEAVSQPLRRIGEVSREAIDSMSDIVWAVNPKFDRATDLATRMRRYVSDLSAGAAIPISFETKGVESSAEIGHELRRDLFLLLKEALNNALRHSNCQRCAAVLSVDSRCVTVEVADDGRGFDPKAPRTGNGLDNMARRAERLGGALRIDSAVGRGTRVELRIPLDAR